MCKPVEDLLPSKYHEKSSVIKVDISRSYFSMDVAAMNAANMVLTRVRENNRIEYGIGIYHDTTRDCFFLTNVREGEEKEEGEDTSVEIDHELNILWHFLQFHLLTIPNLEFCAHVHSHPTYASGIYSQVFSLGDYASYYERQCTGYLVADLKITPFSKAAFVRCRTDRGSVGQLRCPYDNLTACEREDRIIKCMDMTCTEPGGITDMRFTDGILMRCEKPRNNPTMKIDFLDPLGGVTFSTYEHKKLSGLFHNTPLYRGTMGRKIKFVFTRSNAIRLKQTFEKDVIELVEETKKREIFSRHVDVTPIIPFDKIVNNTETLVFKKINYPTLHTDFQKLKEYNRIRIIWLKQQ